MGFVPVCVIPKPGKTRDKSYKILKLMFGFISSISFLVILVFFSACSVYGENIAYKIILKPLPSILMTDIIQQAIDQCAKNGRGTVVFTKGTYLSGSIHLRSNITIQMENGAILQGSDKFGDYIKDAFLFGKNLTDINIEGDGIIDGVDCFNPHGEEGFRGPHCIRLLNCKNISIKGITIINSANYAIYCRNCSSVEIEKTNIRGGHDGLHTRFCDNVKVNGCDFSTGDDAFAGNDNKDFEVTNCSINSSCNGFRLGCLNLTVKKCRIWGPGVYPHKLQNRNNMLAAFVHFSPKDDNPKLKSGNWLIQDVVIENVDQVYNYNFENDKWQTGQPVTDIKFERIKASGILKAFTVTGDTDRTFNLEVINSSFSFRENTDEKIMSFEGIEFPSPAFFDVRNFAQIDLKGVTLERNGVFPLLNLNSGNVLKLESIIFNTGSKSIPYSFGEIEKINKKHFKFNVN